MSTEPNIRISKKYLTAPLNSALDSMKSDKTIDEIVKRFIK